MSVWIVCVCEREREKSSYRVMGSVYFITTVNVATDKKRSHTLPHQVRLMRTCVGSVVIVVKQRLIIAQIGWKGHQI